MQTNTVTQVLALGSIQRVASTILHSDAQELQFPYSVSLINGTMRILNTTSHSIFYTSQLQMFLHKHLTFMNKVIVKLAHSEKSTEAPLRQLIYRGALVNLKCSEPNFLI